MTRRRFIKLLMSYGYQRNMAQIKANRLVVDYGSYEKAWRINKPSKFDPMVKNMFDSLCKGIKNLINQLSKNH